MVNQSRKISKSNTQQNKSNALPNNTDRISALPNNIIHKIIAKLPFRQVPGSLEAFGSSRMRRSGLANEIFYSNEVWAPRVQSVRRGLPDGTIRRYKGEKGYEQLSGVTIPDFRKVRSVNDLQPNNQGQLVLGRKYKRRT